MRNASNTQRSDEMLEINEKLMISSVRQHELAEIATRAEQRLRDLVHGLDAVICEVDTRTGRTAFLSLPADKFLGQSRSDWRANPDFLAGIIHPDDRERAMALYPPFAREGRDCEYEFRALSAGADDVWLRNIVRVVRDADGSVALLRCVIVDVTAQRQAARALEAAYARERNIVDTLQRSLLFMPPEDSFPGLAVKTLYESASHEDLVGGDFWDTFACDHGHVALVLGDVMGHGLPAAVFTAEIKYTLRGFVREHENPARILTQMNAYLCESHRLYEEGLNQEGDSAPVCLALAVIDTATGQGAVAAAGMEIPLLMRAEDRIDELRIDGLPLGILLGEEYEEMAFQLDPGDMLIMTTDGVTEARRGKQFLGGEGLRRLAQEGRSLGTLEKISQAILSGAQEFAGGHLRDDACILLARRSP